MIYSFSELNMYVSLMKFGIKFSLPKHLVYIFVIVFSEI